MLEKEKKYEIILSKIINGDLREFIILIIMKRQTAMERFKLGATDIDLGEN